MESGIFSAGEAPRPTAGGGMSQRFIVPIVSTDALPRICERRGCLADAVHGEMRCKEHRLRKKVDFDAGPILGGVYMISGMGLNAVKIGYAIDINARLSTLQTSNPVDLKAIAAFSVESPRSEKKLHALIDDFRIRGEWFAPRAAIFAALRIAQDERLRKSLLIRRAIVDPNILAYISANDGVRAS